MGKKLKQKFSRASKILIIALTVFSLSGFDVGLGFLVRRAMAAGNQGAFAVYRESTGLDLINTSTTDMDWDTTITEDSIFNLEANNTDITLDESGHYMVNYAVPSDSASGSNRSEMQSWLRLNDSFDLAYGRGQGYIRRSGNNDEGYNAGAAILEVSANDTIRLQMNRTDDNSATVERRANSSGISFLRLSDAWNFIRTRPSSGQSFGSTTNFEDLSLGVDDELDSGGYSRNGSEITLKDQGHYLITYNVGMSHQDTSVRVNNEARLVLDGNEIPGTRVSTYMRGTNSTNDGVTSWVGIIETSSADQILKAQIRRESEVQPSAGQTVKAAETGITIAKLYDGAEYIRLGETGGGQDLNTTQDPITWDENKEVDASSFSHNTSTNSERVDVEADGDYLFFHSMYASRGAGNSNREAQYLQWRKNGSTTYQYGSSGQFNRGDQGSYDARTSGSSGGLIAEGLLDTDYIELTNTNETSNQTSTFQADRMGLQGVRISTLFPVAPITRQIHFRWRDDSTALNSSGGWIANEDTSYSDAEKGETYRLRISVVNSGTAVEAAARAYQLQFAEGTGLSNCSVATGWTAVNASSDAISMVDTANIVPDGQSTTASLLANNESYTLVNGEGRDTSDTTGNIGPLSSGDYTELEYALQPESSTITGGKYCFRLYDSANSEVLDDYAEYPSLTMRGTELAETVAEFGTVSLTDNDYSTVNLDNTYSSLIVVASPRYNPNSQTQRSTRIKNKNGAAGTFEIKVDNYDASLTGSTTVDWLAFESGSHEIDNGSGTTKVIAGSVTTSDVWCNGDYTATGVSVNFSPNFDNSPAVVYSVSSDNDTSWTATQVNDGTQSGEPTSSSMTVALMRGFDTCSHGSESIDYIAFDTGHGTNKGQVEFDAATGSDNISCCDASGNTTNYSSAFSSAPQVTLISQLGEDGGNGGYALTHTGSTGTASAHYGSTDEDGPAADRTHTQEMVGVIAFEPSSGELISTGSFATVESDTYRFYDNTDNITPSSAREDENVDITTPVRGEVLRLRVAIQVGASNLNVGGLSLKLQYVNAMDCENASGWSDVDSSGGGDIWRYYDNSSVSDGATITSSLLNSQSNTLESYVESSPSPTNPNQLNVGDRGEWDFAVQNNGANPGADYCFRLTTNEDTAIFHSNYPQVLAIGAVLDVDIVDGSGGSVSNPSTNFSSLLVDLTCQTSSATFGTASQQIRITNNTMNPSWSLSLAASGGSTALWSSGTPKYDFNDPTGSPPGCDAGLDSDTYAGALNVDPSTAGIFPGGTCNTTGLSLSSQTTFDEGTTDSIELMTASSGAETLCRWDVTGVSAEQTIPGEQNPGSYNLNMILTITAN